MNTLAIIPARGGSKSIPRKNVIDLGGYPLIYYSIKVALDSNEISRVIVSTDDTEIATIACRYGAEIPFMRPEEFAQDESEDYEVFRHALTTLKETENYIPDAVVLLRPTCPLRNVKVVNRALRIFKTKSTADSLRSVSIATETPYKMWRINDNGLMSPMLAIEGNPEPFNTPRQKLPLIYWQNGYIDVTKYSTVIEKHSITGTKILPFVIEEEIVDIDYAEALNRAEQIISGANRPKQSNRDGSIRYPG